MNWIVSRSPSPGACIVQSSIPSFWNRSISVHSPSHSSSSPVMSSISFLMPVSLKSNELCPWFSRVNSSTKGFPRRNSRRSGCHLSQTISDRQGSASSSRAESNGMSSKILWLHTLMFLPPTVVSSSLSMASLNFRRRSSGIPCHLICRYTS